LIRKHTSIADGREIYYSLDLEQISQLFDEAGAALHPILKTPGTKPSASYKFQHPFRILFLCTHNSARSQLAEGIFRWRTQGTVEVFSAGNKPGRVHPLAVRAAVEIGIDIRHQQSKHLALFVDQTFDTVITVCDRVREVCPDFPGNPRMLHWSVPDPTEADGDDREQYGAFRETAAELSQRIGYFLTALQAREM
jgi:protein-tyrosine-phosphatase